MKHRISIKKIIVIVSIACISNHYSYVFTQKEESKNISSMTADEISQKITNFQVALLPSKSFTRVSLPQEEWKSWNTFLSEADQYLKNQNIEFQGLYKQYIYNLKLANFLIETTVSEIKKEINKKKYKELRDALIKKLSTAQEIYRISFNNIVADPKEGPSLKTWKNKVSNEQIGTIFLKLKEFISDYQRAKSADQKIIEHLKETNSQVYYENRQGVINKYVAKGNLQISTLLEKLTKVLFLEEKRWFPKVDIAETKKILQDIKEKFPDELYPYLNAAYADKKGAHIPSVIIVGISGTLIGLLNHVLNSLKDIKIS